MPTARKKASSKKPRASKPTAAQMRARVEYVRRSGYTISREEIEKIIAQWER